MRTSLFAALAVGGIALTSAAARADLINGGFETGTLNGWKSTGNVVVRDTYYHVVKPLQGDDMAVLSPGGMGSSSIAQDIKFTKDPRVLVTFRYNLVGVNFPSGDSTAKPDGDTDRDTLTVTLAGKKLLSVALPGKEIGLSVLGWHTYTATLPVSSLTGSPVLKFSLHHADRDPGEPAHFTAAFVDEVIVQDAPEPASVTLLGLGMAGLYGYRRVRRRA